MAEVNVLILSGVLTEDAVQRPNNGPLSLNIKNVRTIPRNGDPFEKSMYLDVAVWGEAVQLEFSSLKEGDEVIVQGELLYDSWEDGQGNRKGKNKMDCRVVTQVGGTAGVAPAPAAQQTYAPPPTANPLPSDDDIPF